MDRPQFEELDWRQTPLGELVLQRRQVLALDGVVAVEVKLNGEYLMSSLFHEAEDELARAGLALAEGDGLEVVVGGLGLGYTAAEALRSGRVSRLVVIEALQPVIDWHRKGLVPNGDFLASDSRCTLHHADFFAMARGEGFDPDRPGAQWDAILLDIDHTPRHWLNESHADFYTPTGLRRLAALLKPGGVFALWTNDDPDESFMAQLRQVFPFVEGRVCSFPNPLQDRDSANGLILARTAGGEPA